MDSRMFYRRQSMKCGSIGLMPSAVWHVQSWLKLTLLLASACWWTLHGNLPVCTASATGSRTCTLCSMWLKTSETMAPCGGKEHARTRRLKTNTGFLSNTYAHVQVPLVCPRTLQWRLRINLKWWEKAWKNLHVCFFFFSPSFVSTNIEVINHYLDIIMMQNLDTMHV